MLKGSPSRIKDVDSPQIDFAELKGIAVKNDWVTARDDGPNYVGMLNVAPFNINDNRFKELSLREKGPFLMIFRDQMERFDPTACRKYVGMLDKY